MTGRLILVRHGETFSNVEHRLDTALPGAELTPMGVAQAQSLGERLVHQPPAVVISSRALRAQQTAELISGAAGVALEVRDGLHEVQAGELEGRNDLEAIEHYRNVFVGWLHGDRRTSLPGGESALQVLDRFLPVLDDLALQHLSQGSDVVVVSHGAAIRFVATHLTSMEPGFAARNYLNNTESIVMRVVPPAADAADRDPNTAEPLADQWEVLGWGAGHIFGPSDPAVPNQPAFGG